MKRPCHVLGAITLTIALTSALLTGCQTSSSDPFGHDRDGKDQTVKLEDRPPMETMLTRYRAFQADLFAQLGETFGTRTWFVIPGSLGFDRAGCSHNELRDGEEVALPSMTFNGVYPTDRWDAARDLVIEIGKKHGFTHVTMLGDEPGDILNFFGHDRYGARYHFLLGVNTVFGLSTGCHRWTATPTPSPYTPPTAF